jgi:hypothetical protein
MRESEAADTPEMQTASLSVLWLSLIHIMILSLCPESQLNCSARRMYAENVCGKYNSSLGA